jgi:Flp pilus assembly protein TadD
VKNALMNDSQRRLADGMVDRGEYSQAGDIYSQMLEACPSDPHLLALRGYTFYREGRSADALADFNAALALKPDAPNTLFLRAKCKEMLNDLDGAVADYRRVVALAPATADAHSGIAMIYEYRGDLDSAKREHEAARKIDPNLESSARFFQKYGH